MVLVDFNLSTVDDVYAPHIAGPNQVIMLESKVFWREENLVGSVFSIA